MWCGLDQDAGRARDLLARELQGLYGLPYDRFQHVAPAGTPARIADWLAPFIGHAEHITLVPAAASAEAGIDLVAQVRAHLLAS